MDWVLYACVTVFFFLLEKTGVLCVKTYLLERHWLEVKSIRSGYSQSSIWQANAINRVANTLQPLPEAEATPLASASPITADTITFTPHATAIRSGKSSTTNTTARIAPVASDSNPSAGDTSWYAPHVAATQVKTLNPEEYSKLDWQIFKWANSVLDNLHFRPKHEAGQKDLPGHKIPNLQDPAGDLINGVKIKNPDGPDSFKLPMTFEKKLFGPIPFFVPLPTTWKDRMLCLSILGNAWMEKAIAPVEFWKKAKPLWVESQLDLNLGKINPKTNLPYTQPDKDEALKACIRILGKNSVGMAKFLQIISNNPNAKRIMPEPVYQALSSFQSDLPPTWQPEEVVKWVEDEFKRGAYLESIANRFEDKQFKALLLKQGKVVIELLKNDQGEVEPLGVASTAEVYRCNVRVVNRKGGKELLSQQQLLGDDTARIIKILKKNLVKPTKRDWITRTIPKNPEDFPKKQLALDRELVMDLFNLVSDDPRVLEYWQNQADTLYKSWEQEVDLRNGAENGKMLAEAAILRDNNGNPVHGYGADGKPYRMFDVALSDFSTYCVDLQAQAKGVSLKTLEEIKEYTGNIINEGVFAYLDNNPKATLREIMASPAAQKAIALAGLKRFKLDPNNQTEQTESLKLRMETLWEETTHANRPANKEIATAINFTNQLEGVLHEVMTGVTINPEKSATTSASSVEGLQQLVNQALLKELKETHEKILVKTIGLVQQYPWLVTDPNLMMQVGESFAQASTTQMTQTTLREGETEAKMRLHMDVTKANAFVYRDDALFEKLKGAGGGKNQKESSAALLKRVQKILLDPTIQDKAERLKEIALEGNMNPYRIQYIDTGGVESISKDLFINDLNLVMGFCTGNPQQLHAYFNQQITYKELSSIEKNRLLKTHNLQTLIQAKNLPRLLDVFVEELYSQPVTEFLANNPIQKAVLEADIENLLQAKNPLEAFFTKLKEERITLFKAELPSLFNSQIFEIKGNVQSFDLAWSLVQSELCRRRISYNFPHYDILKAKLLQVTTGYSLLEKGGGDFNALLVKSLFKIFDKAHTLAKKAFDELKNESLTHMFIAQPEQAGKMMALFLPEAAAETIANTVKGVERIKQALPWMLAAVGTLATAGFGIIKYNAFEVDKRKHLQAAREEKAFIANIALAQKQHKKLSKTTPSLKQKGLLG